MIASAATGAAIESYPLGFGIVAALLATAASNAWNQFYDLEIDRVNKPDRPLPAGALQPRSAMMIGWFCAIWALIFAVVAAPMYGAFVFAGTALTWIYSAPPLRTKSRPLGALLTIAVARGLLVPVAGWSLVADVATLEPWYLGAVVGLFVFGAAATKDFGDVEGDRAHGIRTLPVLLGTQRAARFIAPSLFLPFLLYPVGGYIEVLQPPIVALWILAGALFLSGTLAAWLLLVKPAGAGGRNHPAWALMYLLMLGMHAGTAVVYRVTL